MLLKTQSEILFTKFKPELPVLQDTPLYHLEIEAISSLMPATSQDIIQLL